ncbi:MAG: hypothetical protein WBG50_00635 [Desulfomonilaceae bacterium]
MITPKDLPLSYQPRVSQLIKILLLGILLCCAVLLAVRAAMFMGWYISRDYPLEYREFAVIFSTDLLLQGYNPYSIALQPVAMNAYGIVYNLLVLPLAHVWGSTPYVHRVVSCFFIVMTCGCLLWGLRLSRVSWSMAVVAVATLFAFLATGLSIVSRPDSLGQFLFLASIVVPFAYKYSVPALAISIALCLLGLLTKPYFVLGAPFMAGYLFAFESKSKGLWYALGFGVALTATLFATNALCETWLTNTIFNHLNNDLSGQYTSVTHLRVQMWVHAESILGFIAAFIWAYGFSVGSGEIAFKRSLGSLFNFKNFDKPLIEAEGDLPFMMLLFGTIIMVWKLGLHTGNWQLYYHQFMTPFALWFVVAFIDGLKINRHWEVLLPLIANLTVLNLFYVSGDLEDHTEEWKALEQVVASHQDMYHSAGLAYLMRKYGKPIYNTGHDEYYAASVPHNFTSTAEQFAWQSEMFWGQIEEKAQSKQLDLIIQDSGAGWPIDRNVLKKNYRLLGYMQMPLLFDGNWPLELWIPKPDRKE